MSETRRIDRPAAGFWMVRLAKSAPEVPAAIIWLRTECEPGEQENLMERSGFLAAFINGEPAALHQVWERRGRVITGDEYAFQLADIRWARQHAPDEPKANPRRPVDLLQAPLPF